MNQIAGTCPLCGQQYKKKRLYQIAQDFEPVMDLSEQEKSMSQAVMSEYVALHCGHAFPRGDFIEFENKATEHDKCARSVERKKAGLTQKAMEHYLEDVLESIVCELQAQLREQAVAVEPEKDPYLNTTP